MEKVHAAIKSSDSDKVRALLLTDKSLTTSKHKFESLGYDPEVQLDAYKFLGAYIGAVTILQLAILEGKGEIQKKTKHTRNQMRLQRTLSRELYKAIWTLRLVVGILRCILPRSSGLARL
jgi:hypothetical protein